MKNTFTRRNALRASAGAALIAGPGARAAGKAWPVREGETTPKLCLGVPLQIDEARLRHISQIGVGYVLSGGPPIPWSEEELRAHRERFRAHGLELCNLMIHGFPNTIYGRPGRDEEIDKVAQSIRAAGKAGLPVVEYNFYAHRLVEGYYEEKGRAGSGLTAFTYSRVKDLPPLPGIGAHSLEDQWKNITYFLKAIVPVAEKAGVRLALHPNDPPAPLSRGSGQIMSTLAGWKRLISIVDSPANGITYDCGVTRELGEDPVEVARYFGSRDRINHAHYRNVRLRKPYEDYTEVWLDEGEVDMFAVMRELVRLKYPRYLYPEHPRAIDLDRACSSPKPYYPGGGSVASEVYNVAYARAMLQAALSE